MSDLSNIFRQGCKVVISPDKMRAWITLVKPAPGVTYTAAAVTEWLPQNGVLYGANPEMIRQAVSSGKYDDLLEVARGLNPVSANGGDYTLKIEKRPFTGLRAGSDGSLIYEDVSFLQEVAEGQVLAEVVPPVEAADGMTVTGEVVKPRPGQPGRELAGSGFAITDNGTLYRAPSLSHVSIVNDQLVVTPVKKVETVPGEETLDWEGNVVITGDITSNVTINATGSIYVLGRAVAGTYNAGNNILFANGLRVTGTIGSVKAKGHVWGLAFENVEIDAGGELHANHLTGCTVTNCSRASILGGRSAITATDIKARGGIVCGQLGSANQDRMTAQAGMDQETIDAYQALTKKVEKLEMDTNALMQNISTFERLNRQKADRGKNDPKYKIMISQRDQSLSVLEILRAERLKTKRGMEQASTANIIVKDTAFPGVSIVIDTRVLNILSPMKQTKFRRVDDRVEAQAIGGR